MQYTGNIYTGNYVTPELFSPPGTAYHTAQSTAVHSNSGRESTLTPGSGRSGVYSGYGHSQNSQTNGVPDSTPVSNSNGQPTEQKEEQSTRPQLSPAKEKTVETEQRKVLVFNTDTEDSDEQSDDRKRSRKRGLSKKRGISKKVGKDPVDSADRGRARKVGKDPAGSDGKKRSTSKAGKDYVDSDHRGRSKSKRGRSPTESGDKKQTSKLRRARSASRGRKKKPRRDESSSSSSSSPERAGSSKKSTSERDPR